ncbi:MAG: iron chaperone [Sphingobacteriaceae bacterium]
MVPSKEVSLYITTFPKATQVLLKELRECITSTIPNATEVISYGMPAYKQHGVLVYFAAYQNHIGFYPTPNGIKQFESEFGKYKYSKGAVQFQLDEKLPFKLIIKMVKFRAKEDLAKFNKKI